MCGQQRVSIPLLTILIVAMTGVPTVGAAQPGPTVRVEPASLEISPGESFQIQLTINDTEDLGGFQIEVGYDPAVVEVGDVTVGDFLTSSGRSKIPVGPQVDNEAGTVVFGAVTLGDSPGADGSGVLATIDGKAVAGGSSDLELRDVQILNTGATAQTVGTENGQVVVAAAEGDADAPAGADADADAEVESEVAAPESPGAPTSSVRWGLIAPAAVLAVVGVGILFFALRGRKTEA